MSTLRRAFVAVVLPELARRWVESARNAAVAVAPELRWSRPEQWHLTMKFFGAVPDADALAALVTDSVGARAPFTITLGGGGAFPNARRASVLWLGVREGNEPLAALAAPFADTDSADDRPFRAHLTLARAGKQRDLRAAVDALDGCGASAPWTVDEVVLFESVTRATGAVHTEQGRFRLAG